MLNSDRDLYKVAQLPTQYDHLKELLDCESDKIYYTIVVILNLPLRHTGSHQRILHIVASCVKPLEHPQVLAGKIERNINNH